MPSQLLSVMKIVRPRHFLKAVRHPVQQFRIFQYHYRRVPERAFVAFLANLADNHPRLRSVYDDLKIRHAPFLNRLKSKLSIHADGYGGQMTREATAVYALVRLLQPEVMLETGVADGATTALILRALEDNGKGKLHSIDVPSDLLPPGKTSGWAVDDELKHRWDLRLGKSSDLLEPLLKELGEIDIFLHDSLHTYENMIFEYRTVWLFLRRGGLFLSHDVGANFAFLDFADEVGMRWRDWRVYHVLGGFRVPDSKGTFGRQRGFF